MNIKKRRKKIQWAITKMFRGSGTDPADAERQLRLILDTVQSLLHRMEANRLALGTKAAPSTVDIRFGEDYDDEADGDGHGEESPEKASDVAREGREVGRGAPGPDNTSRASEWTSGEDEAIPQLGDSE